MPYSAESPLVIDLDVAILGGGIAGLWLANRLQQDGYQIALFEKYALGSGQTMASQGMIHGGMKYTLAGALSGASEAIADMPQHWRKCLCGEGDVDISATRILSDHFYLWSGENVTSRLTGFFASKLIRGRVDAVADDRRPSLLRHADFRGTLYKIGDMVLDVPSLVANLARPLEHHLFQYPDHTLFQLTADGALEMTIPTAQGKVRIRARRFVFTAGEGNEALMQSLQIATPAMQRRPLQQVLVKHKHLHRFYGHCLGTGSTPRLTISSHSAADGKMVWYLGGQLAEEGADQSPQDVITAAREELAALMPWLDFSEAEWATLPVNRAEPRQQGLARPDNAFASRTDKASNVIVGWPTKLTLAPNFGNQMLALLQEDGLLPSQATPAAVFRQLADLLPAPAIAMAPWDIAFPMPAYQPETADDDDE
ncbi:NAD(P)/FAD-dependent oxidoreductase [Cellvibrio polysaccharolyticus]|uniref:FAD-dependent oxidoreductase n=1 Tax=Cellvibrio polysaccharolyticus TaxID=2082724 RepID=A0A928V9X4_9GAMM|nr:FAD-dependent oxidoreductase [Cellvibrio polysaccharolyticus]MBE8718714.1 FAD-dependent oxidoreductase [Cellvibrio polysaccharolyticus]